MLLKISQNSQENTCARDSFLIKLQACSFIKKVSLAQVLSSEFCEIFKNTLTTASEEKLHFFSDQRFFFFVDSKEFSFEH